MKATNVLSQALDEAPGSIRELAREAGVSKSLLLAIRDGRRRLTGETRAKVVAALRRWEATTGDLADALETADLDRPGGNDE